MNYEEQLQSRGCPVEQTVEVIGGRWTTLIINQLLEGTKRYSELRNALTGVSPKTLTDKLRDLEKHGIVTRVVYPSVPPKVEYTLTVKGLELKEVIGAMQSWGSRWGSTDAAPHLRDGLEGV
ncbi:winged helix-turn-helix transcriptional regulator [Deinococcus oregonensis]|uniref:Winged helix-turn-helix transcriptional regulator n=1 Tax=Deinococcus oregonensis TaxID=1805970 RepID=A0ABV6B4D2_9DEIO